MPNGRRPQADEHEDCATIRKCCLWSLFRSAPVVHVARDAAASPRLAREGHRSSADGFAPLWVIKTKGPILASGLIRSAEYVSIGYITYGPEPSPRSASNLALLDTGGFLWIHITMPTPSMMQFLSFERIQEHLTAAAVFCLSLRRNYAFAPGSIGSKFYNPKKIPLCLLWFGFCLANRRYPWG